MVDMMDVPDEEVDNWIRSCEYHLDSLRYQRQRVNNEIISIRKERTMWRDILREMKERKKAMK